MIDIGEQCTLNMNVFFLDIFYCPKEIPSSLVPFSFFLSLLFPSMVCIRLWAVTFCVHVEVVNDNRSQ